MRIAVGQNIGSRSRRPGVAAASRSSRAKTAAAGVGFVIGRTAAANRRKPLQARFVVRLAIVDRAADLRVHRRAAQFFVRNFLADRAFHQRRAGQIQARAFGHQQLVAQHRQISAAGDAVAHDGGDLLQAHRRDHRVVAKDAAEIVFVGKHIFLQRQKHAGRIDQVNQRQPILHGDPLRPQHLLGGGGKERPGFHRGVVGDDHVPPPADRADAGHHAGRRCAAPLGIHLPGGPQTKFEERRAGSISFSIRSRAVSRFFLCCRSDGRLPAAEADVGFLLGELSDEFGK